MNCLTSNRDGSSEVALLLPLVLRLTDGEGSPIILNHCEGVNGRLLENGRFKQKWLTYSTNMNKQPLSQWLRGI